MLSFKGLGRIENLVGFDRLTSLCLDNNAIEDMSAVSGLPHLTVRVCVCVCVCAPLPSPLPLPPLFRHFTL